MTNDFFINILLINYHLQLFTLVVEILSENAFRVKTLQITELGPTELETSDQFEADVFVARLDYEFHCSALKSDKFILP